MTDHDQRFVGWVSIHAQQGQPKKEARSKVQYLILPVITSHEGIFLPKQDEPWYLAGKWDQVVNSYFKLHQGDLHDYRDVGKEDWYIVPLSYVYFDDHKKGIVLRAIGVLCSPETSLKLVNNLHAVLKQDFPSRQRLFPSFVIEQYRARLGDVFFSYCEAKRVETERYQIPLYEVPLVPTGGMSDSKKRMTPHAGGFHQF